MYHTGFMLTIGHEVKCVLWTPWNQPKCPDYQGVLIFQVSLHNNVSFGTTAIDR